MNVSLEITAPGAQRYVSKYSHLENTIYVGEADVRVLSHTVRDEGGLDECQAYVYGVTILTREQGMCETKVKDAIRRALSRECGCEHDCCGCYFGGVRQIERQTDTYFVVQARYHRNN